ncbi:hypothetical protein [Brevibacillus centrosporus]|uniref:hypothetical protein n=1 Tax=Brevibacillus centrosporus TaxID=54910 RepID=UPI0039862E58
MNIKKMISEIEPKELDTEMMIAILRNQSVELYNRKDVTQYVAVLNDMLQLAINLKQDLVLKHFGAAPVVASDETMQLQEMFKCLALRSRNSNWFLDLFGLFLGLAVVLRFRSDEIESTFFQVKH